MKKRKGLLSFMLTLALCLSLCNVTVFAAEDVNNVSNSAENVAVAADVIDYSSAWVPAGVTEGSFRIEKTFSGTGRITFKARSDNSSTRPRMCLSMFNMGATMSLTGWIDVPATDTDIYPTSTVDGKYNLYVHYEFPNGNPNGTFLMCWIYP